MSAGTRGPSCSLSTDLTALAEDAAAGGRPATSGCRPSAKGRPGPSQARPGRAAGGEGSASPSCRPGEAGPGRTASTQRGGAGRSGPDSPRRPEGGKPPSFGPKLGLPCGGASAPRGLRGAERGRPGTSPQTFRASLPGGGGPAASFPSAFPAAQRPHTPRHHYPPPQPPAFPLSLSLPHTPPPCRRRRRRPALLTPPSSRPRGALRTAARPRRSPASRCSAPSSALCLGPARARSLPRSHTKRRSGGRAAAPLSAPRKRRAGGGGRDRPEGSASCAGIYHAIAGYGFRVIPCRRGEPARGNVGGRGALTGASAGGAAHGGARDAGETRAAVMLALLSKPGRPARRGERQPRLHRKAARFPGGKSGDSCRDRGSDR